MQRFEIHAHTDKSNIRLLDSINKPKDLILTSHELGLKGVCFTDHEALSAHVEALQLEEQFKKDGTIPEDFRVGLGNEIYLCDEESERYFHFILIAKNKEGHKALKELSTIAWLNAKFEGMQRVPTSYASLKEIVEKYPNTLIATTACIGGELGYVLPQYMEACNQGREEDARSLGARMRKFVEFCQTLFQDDFYFEVAPSHMEDILAYNQGMIGLAESLGIKVVIGTDAHYPRKEDRLVHKAFLRSKEGEREVDAFYSSAHLMDSSEIIDYFKEYCSIKQIEEFFLNSLEIMDKIESYSLKEEQHIPLEKVKYYPISSLRTEYRFKNYPILSKMLSSAEEQDRYWANSCLEALKEKNLISEKYMDRLEIEADIIDFISEKMHQPLTGYFNTLQFYIDIFWECGSIIGPGRGSAVGFLSNYLLGITQVDPIVWDLPYWRFLNKERVELPDIDIDLAPSKRALIFEKIRELKGNLRLLQVCTFGTETTRSAIHTACRGYSSEAYPDGVDPDSAQYMSSLVPEERGFLWSLKEVYYGDDEKDRPPVRTFIQEVDKYPGLFKIMSSIEGLVNQRSQHASGVVLYNTDPWETNAIMRSPSGDITTQFNLDDSEYLGDLKYDFLSTEVSDKIINCITLLKEDKVLPPTETLRETYNRLLHPEKMDVSDERIWDALAAGDVLDVFQFNSNVGLQAAKLIKPTNPIEMTSANALMRLTAEKGEERPLDRYARLKNNPGEWVDELKEWGLTEEDIEIIKPYYVPRYGTPCMQEDLMQIVMDPKISNFTLKESNDARKIVARKQMERIPELQEKFFSQCRNRRLAEYVWETVILPQLGYAFSTLHSLVYSFVGIQTLVLATSFNRLYWNCAVLISNSGGAEELEDLEEDNEEEEGEDTIVVTGKKKKRSTDYGKIGVAIGSIQEVGVKISSPNINKSKYTFSPDIENNVILYGMKGITKVGDGIVLQIIENRPYSSIYDFLSKIKVNKPQMVNLIKSGAFDDFAEDRKAVMKEYIDSISDKKKTVNLRNVMMLARHGLFPEEQLHYARIFVLNRHLRAGRKDGYYPLDEESINFYSKYFDVDKIEYVESEPRIFHDTWDSIYKEEIDVLRQWIKANSEDLIAKLNQSLIDELWEKYAKGSISKWEMDSISFYCHEHELANLQDEGITNFYDLPEKGIVDQVLYFGGKAVPLYKLSKIAGTVLDKDKDHSTVVLLTTDGVVRVRVYKNQFASYDKQISALLPNGKRKILEKSWFSRGNMLTVVGFRRGDEFIPKKYKKSSHKEIFHLITEVNEDGTYEVQTERVEE